MEYLYTAMTMYLILFSKLQHDIIYQHTFRETCFICANHIQHKYCQWIT